MTKEDLIETEIEIMRMNMAVFNQILEAFYPPDDEIKREKENV